MKPLDVERRFALGTFAALLAVIWIRPGPPLLGGVDAGCYARIASERAHRPFADGARLTLGSDSHAVIDLFEEMRAVELDERLATQQRGHWTAAELLTAATTDGHASLGWDDAGAIAVGRRADLVVVDPASPRTAIRTPCTLPPFCRSITG